VLIKETQVELSTPSGPMRTRLFQPAGPEGDGAAGAGAGGAAGRHPGIVLFSEIFQITGPIARTARILAGQGYLVAAPEVYHEFEPPGTVLAYDQAGTDKGNRYKIEKPLAAFDADARAVIDHLLGRADCTGKLGAMGMCLGGHLAFRCAMDPRIQAAACFYATDIHKRSLGKGEGDDSLGRLGEIKGELSMIWGKQDPHIPAEGRAMIHRRLSETAVNFTWHEFNAAHAFLRDEGPRHNPALARICYAMVDELFGRRLR
jgi:carboxymethylenebutenolidase